MTRPKVRSGKHRIGLLILALAPLLTSCKIGLMNPLATVNHVQFTCMNAAAIASSESSAAGIRGCWEDVSNA